jgi:hypothetical protein
MTTTPTPDHSFADLALPEPTPALAPDEVGAPMFMRALLSVMDELDAIDPRRLVPVNVDVTAATTLVIGAARELRGLRPEMVEWFGEDMAAAVDRLELLSRALSQAHARHSMADTGESLEPLVAAVTEVRAGLLAEVASLGARKRLAPGSLGPMRRRGFRNLGFDVLQLVTFFNHEWSAIQDATGYTREDLDHAEGLANQLITAIGIREQAPRSPTAVVRQRAFTLLSETYDDVRRMVGFLRWKQGDADRFAPSWHRGPKPQRTRRGGDAGAEPSAETTRTIP